MNKTTKATLWILGVFAALSLGVYFAGCGSDEAADAGAGEPAGCAKAGDACEGGKCLAVMADKPECYKECGTAGDACEGGNCYYMDPDGLYCLPTGTKAVGEACGVANDCVGGAVCAGEGTLQCWQVCADDTACAEGSVCTDVGLSFKVCAEATE